MERKDWIEENGKPFCKSFCPVSATEKSRHLKASERKSLSKDLQDSGEEDSESTEKSTLELRYDWQLHQMVGYMCRLDEAKKSIWTRTQCMIPLARKGQPKFITDGSRNPFFGFWFYVGWYEVIVPVLQRMLGEVVNIKDEEELDKLLGATVMM